MDLKSQLLKRKSALKPCTTILTDFQGHRYEVSNGEKKSQLPSVFPFVVDRKPDMQLARVLPTLFLSSQDPASCFEILESNEIRHILSVGVDSPDVKFPGIKYYSCPLLDLPEISILDPLKTCLRIIRCCGEENLLVHCNAGVSRSTTVVIAYLMTLKKLDYERALNEVKKVRPCAKPNEGFARQLRQLNPRDFAE